MGFSFRRFFIGAATLAASFIPSAPAFLASALRIFGLGQLGGSIQPDAREPIRSKSQGTLIQSANTLNALPVIYSARGVRVAGKVVFLDTRNTRSDSTRGTDGTNALADVVIAFCLGNRTPVSGEEAALAVKAGATESFGTTYAAPDEAGIAGFGDIYFDDRLVYTAKKIVVLRAFRFFVVGEGPLVADDLIVPIHLRHGLITQEADPYLVELNTILDGEPVWAHGDSEWTVDHRGAWVADITMGLWWDKNALTTIPLVTGVLKGRQVRSLLPLTGLENWKPSSNPPECILDLLLDHRIGLGLTVDEVAEPWFRGTAEYCAAVVDNPDGSQGPRYLLDGVVETDRPIQENLSDMLSTFGGALDWSMGRFYTRHRDPNRPAVLDLNESNIIGEWSWDVAPPEEQANIIVAQYQEPTPYDSGLADDIKLLEGAPSTALREEVEQVQFPGLGVANSFVDEDRGIEIIRTIDLPMTRDAQIATRRATEEHVRARSDLIVSLKANEQAAILALFDRVTITHPRPGWIRKPFEVQRIELYPVSGGDGNVGLVLREEAAGLGPPGSEPVVLNGQPFEIIQVPSSETRPPRVWITLPFAREGFAMLAVIDLPDMTIEHVPDPIFPNNLQQSYWAACHIPSRNEVWVANNQGGKWINVFNATDKSWKYTRDMNTLLGGRTIWDMEYHAATDTVVLGTSNGVYKIALDTQVVLGGPMTASDLHSVIFGDPLGVQNTILEVVEISATLWAAISLHDYAWYFNPVDFTRDDTLAVLDGPIGGLVDPGGDWLNQADVIGSRIYHAAAILSSVRSWEQGTATGFPVTASATGQLELAGQFNFVEHCPTFDQGDLLALSKGTGSQLVPGPSGSLVVHRPGGSSVEYGLGFHPGRNVYVPELNWVVVTSYWRSVATALGIPGPPKLAQAIAIGSVPPNAPGGTPPFEPPDDEFEDPDAPPEPGPDDGVGDPNDPLVTPTISGSTYCADSMVQVATNTFQGSVDTGWKVTLEDADFPAGTEGVDFEAKDHPHEVVVFAAGADPNLATPLDVVPIPVPVEGGTHQRSVFLVSGTYTGSKPQCGGPSDTPDKSLDIYVRRHVQGFLPGPLSNKIAVTIKHPGPAGDTGLPPDTGVGAPSWSTSNPICRSDVSGSTDDRSGTVRVFGDLRAREHDNGDDMPIEVYEMELDDDPDVDTPIQSYRPPTSTTGVARVITEDVIGVAFQHVLDADVPTCGEPHPTEPDILRDYYARHRTSDGPGPWSVRLRLRYKYPGPAGEQDDQGGGWAPVALEVRDIICQGSGETITVYARIDVTKDIDPDNPFTNVPPKLYVMEVGDHPDTDQTADMPTGQAFLRNGISLRTSSLNDVMVGRPIYGSLAERQAAVCEAGSVLYTFDMYVRHESPTKGNSDWLGPVTLQYRLPTDPV